MIAIIDYGVGNLYSLKRSLDFLGAASVVSRDAEVLDAAEKLILPGVGAFGDAMAKLRETGLDALVVRRAKAGVPLLGICLGMQLLFERSFEYGEHAGLGLLPGEIVPLRGEVPDCLKVPHMGWNALNVRRAHPLLSGVQSGDAVYYVHSYYARCPGDLVMADSEYAVRVPGLVAREHVCGAQFHPEKSGAVGLNILGAFAGKGAQRC